MVKNDEEELTDESIYNDETREDLVDDGALSPEEAAFMKGYDEADEEEKEGDDMQELDEDADI